MTYQKLDVTRFLWLGAFLLVLPMVGCGGKSLRGVSGKVTLNGEPVESGSIQFLPTGEGTPEGGDIVNGEYSANVSLGEMKVKIFASRPHPTKTEPGPEPGGPEVPVLVDYIPKKYNEKTGLIVTIKGGGETHNFELNGPKP